MRTLAVYNNDVLAGILTENAPGHGYAFQYEDSYITSGGNPISLTLPIQKEAFRSKHLFPFFTNMVPEGANRKMICRSHRIDEDDFFGLLTVMAGKDCIGAVNLRQTEE